VAGKRPAIKVVPEGLTANTPLFMSEKAAEVAQNVFGMVNNWGDDWARKRAPHKKRTRHAATARSPIDFGGADRIRGKGGEDS